MVGLKVYQVKDKETYNHLHNILSGWVFFRQDSNEYFIKAPNNKVIKSLIETGAIIELSQMKTV